MEMSIQGGSESISRPEGHSGCSHEAMNARLFWALEAPIGEDRADDVIEGAESVREEPDDGSHSDATKGKKRQKNFVKRNIELVRGRGGQVLLTQAEEERLTELLRDIDEEEENSARGTDNEEDMWAVPVSASQGYTPETSDLQQLIAIDSKLRLFQPAVELSSLQRSYALLKEERASDIDLRHDGDPQPGEKVLRDIKERRTQEKQLLEIQRQLDLLGQDQEMTSEPESLSEEQLLFLLNGCELTETEPEP